MKVTNLEFNLLETATLKMRAVCTLVGRGVPLKEAREQVSNETPPNILRLALDFDTRKRGGIRTGGFEPGNQHAKQNS